MDLASDEPIQFADPMYLTCVPYRDVGAVWQGVLTSWFKRALLLKVCLPADL